MKHQKYMGGKSMLWILNKRLNQWKNFKATVEQNYPFVSKIDKDTRFILSDLMNKGNVLQKRLELMNLQYDFQFKEALKIANVQEMIINEIVEFRSDVIKLQKQELKEQQRKENNKKQSKTSLINIFQMN